MMMTRTLGLLLAAALAVVANGQFAVDPLGLVVIRRIGRLNDTAPAFREATVENVRWDKLRSGLGYQAGPAISLFGALLDTVKTPLHGAVRASGDTKLAVLTLTKAQVNEAYDPNTAYDIVVAVIDPTQFSTMTARPQTSQLGLLSGGVWMYNRTGPALATWWYDYGSGAEGRPVSPTGSAFSWSTTGTFFQMPSPAPMVAPRSGDMPSALTLQHQGVWGGDLYSVTANPDTNDVLVVYKQPLPSPPSASTATLTNFTVNADQAWAVIAPGSGGLPAQYRVVGMAHVSPTVVWFAGRAEADDAESHLFAVNVTGPAFEYFQGTPFPSANAAFLFVVTPPAGAVVLDLGGRWECGTFVLYALFTNTIMLVDGATGQQMGRYAIPDALNLPPVSLAFMPNATGCSSGVPFTPECAADQDVFCSATAATASPTPAISPIPTRNPSDLLLVTAQYAAYRSNLSAISYPTASGGSTYGVSLAARLWVADSVVPTVLKMSRLLMPLADPRGVVRACALPITDLQRDSVVTMTSTSDRQFALLPCFDVQPYNRTQLDEFMVPAVARVYARIRADLSLDYSTVASGDDGAPGVPNRYPRNLASVDGSVIFAPSWAVLASPAQLNVVPAGAFYEPPTPALQTPVASMYGVLIVNDTLFGVWKNAISGPVQLWQVGDAGALPAVGATGVPVAPACSWNNLSPFASNPVPVVDPATNTFYFGAQATIVTGTCHSGLLTPLLLLPSNGSATIVALIGRQEAAGFVLFAVLREAFLSEDTGAPTVRTSVYRITPGGAPGEVPLLLQQRVCTGNASEVDITTACLEIRSITFVPVSPTPSATPSRTPSTTASTSLTPSPSSTPSVVASASRTSTVSASATLSPSSSASRGAGGGAAGGDGILVPPGAVTPDMDPLFIAIGGGAAAALLGAALGRCACIIRRNRSRRQQARKTQRWQQLRSDTKTQTIVAGVLQQISGVESTAASRRDATAGSLDMPTVQSTPARRRVIADPRRGEQVEVELPPAASKIVIEAVVLETLDTSMQALRSRAVSSRLVDDQRMTFLPQKASGGAAMSPGTQRSLAGARGASGRFSVVSPLQQRAAPPAAPAEQPATAHQLELEGLMELVGFIAGEVAADVLDVQPAAAALSAQPQHHRKASIAVQRTESSGVARVEIGKRQKAGHAPVTVQHAATVQKPARLLTPSARLERIEDISRRAAAQPNVPLPVARQHADIKRIVTAAYATGEGAANAAAARIAGVPIAVPRPACVPMCAADAAAPSPQDTMMLFVDDALRVAAKLQPSAPVAVPVLQPDIPRSAQPPAAPRTTSVRVTLEVDGSPGLPATQASSKTAIKRQSVFSGGGALGGKFQANPLRSTSRQARR